MRSIVDYSINITNNFMSDLSLALQATVGQYTMTTICDNTNQLHVELIWSLFCSVCFVYCRRTQVSLWLSSCSPCWCVMTESQCSRADEKSYKASKCCQVNSNTAVCVCECFSIVWNSARMASNVVPVIIHNIWILNLFFWTHVLFVYIYVGELLMS